MGKFQLWLKDKLFQQLISLSYRLLFLLYRPFFCHTDEGGISLITLPKLSRFLMLFSLCHPYKVGICPTTAPKLIRFLVPRNDKLFQQLISLSYLLLFLSYRPFFCHTDEGGICPTTVPNLSRFLVPRNDKLILQEIPIGINTINKGHFFLPSPTF